MRHEQKFRLSWYFSLKVVVMMGICWDLSNFSRLMNKINIAARPMETRHLA